MESMFLEIAVTEREMDRRLLEVAINGDTKELDQLLQEDSRILDREMTKCEKEGKDNPVHIAALYGHVDFMREMLRLKWDFTRRLNSQGQSPLHLAIARGQVEVVKEILKADPGACFVRDRDGMIPLHLAAIEGRLDVLKNLVEANKTTAFVLTERGEPILHLCVKNNQKKALKLLVELVDNPNFVKLKDSDDNTILHVIMQANNQSVKAPLYLLKKGVLDVNAKNKNGFTPAEVLVGSGSVFGIRGFINLWMLVMLCRAGARLGNILLATPWLVLRPTDARWVIKVLLVVAILTVTVAFQAGINPPGGFWQSTGVYNGTKYYPGQSVMSSVDPKRYRDFSDFTGMTASCSVFAILLMICSWQSNSSPQIFNLLAILSTSISICTMAASYDVAHSFLSPDYEDHTLSFFYSRKIVYVIVVLNLLVILFVASLSEFLHQPLL